MKRFLVIAFLPLLCNCGFISGLYYRAKLKAELRKEAVPLRVENVEPCITGVPVHRRPCVTVCHWRSRR